MGQINGLLESPAKSLQYTLLDWREHMAHVRGCSADGIVSKSVLFQLIQNPTESIVSIQKIFNQANPLHKVTFQIVQLISALISCWKSTKDHLQIDSPSENIGEMLTELGWNNRDQWLNRTNDKAIELYKQIVSIQQFDFSIAQACLDPHSHFHFPNSQLRNLFKCAQCIRNNDNLTFQSLHRQNQTFFNENKCKTLKEYQNLEQEKQIQIQNNKNVTMNSFTLEDITNQSIRPSKKLDINKKNELKKNKGTVKKKNDVEWTPTFLEINKMFDKIKN